SAVTSGTGPTLTALFNPSGATATVNNGCVGGAPSGSNPTTQTFTCNPIVGNTTYTLSVALGTATATATTVVTVVAAPTASLAVSASDVAKGGTVTFTATFTNAATSFIADDTGAHVVDNPITGTPTTPVTVNRTTTYTLVVSNAAGSSATDSVTVT